MIKSKKRTKISNSNSIIRGIGSIMSVFSGYYDDSVVKTISHSDRVSMKNDWKAIAGDFDTSFKKIKLAK